MNPVKKVDKLIRTVASYLNYASCFCLFAMMAFVTVYVLVRAVFGYAIFGTFEIVQLSSLLVVTLSLLQNEYDSGNITIDSSSTIYRNKIRHIILSCFV